MADAGVGNELPSHNAFHQSSLPLLHRPHLSTQPWIQPRPMMPRPRAMAGPRFRGPLVQSLSAVEPQMGCSSADDFIALVVVFMLACIGFWKSQRLKKLRGMQEPLMDA
jgi:hypothetical protein